MVNEFIAYGYPTRKMVNDLVRKRGFLRKDNKKMPITDNVLIEELFTEFTDEAHFWNVVVGLGSLGIPILYHARIGHGDEHNHPLALGAMYEVTCISGQTVGTLTILDK